MSKQVRKLVWIGLLNLFIDGTKDPRRIKSYPCSPRTGAIAVNKWSSNFDEANISLEDNPGQPKTHLPFQRILSIGRKFLKTNKYSK